MYTYPTPQNNVQYFSTQIAYTKYAFNTCHFHSSSLQLLTTRHQFGSVAVLNKMGGSRRRRRSSRSQPGLQTEAGPKHKESSKEQTRDHLLPDSQPSLAVVLIATQCEMTEDNSLISLVKVRLAPTLTDSLLVFDSCQTRCFTSISCSCKNSKTTERVRCWTWVPSVNLTSVDRKRKHIDRSMSFYLLHDEWLHYLFRPTTTMPTKPKVSFLKIFWWHTVWPSG